VTEPISSPRNRRIAWARRLRIRKHREAEGLFLVEGLQLIHMALASGRAPVVLFYCEEFFAGPGAPALRDRCRAAGTELLPVAGHVLAGLSARDQSQGLLAVLPSREDSLDRLLGAGRGLAVVLDRLQTPGNIGTLIRTADAVGATAVVLLEPGADPHDPAAVRASMGSLFNLPLIRCTPAEAFAALRQGGWSVLGADPCQGVLWHRLAWPERLALVLGNEARGVAADVRDQVPAWVRLPMVGGAESLNVAVATAALLFEAQRQRRACQAV